MPPRCLHTRREVEYLRLDGSYSEHSHDGDENDARADGDTSKRKADGDAQDKAVEDA